VITVGADGCPAGWVCAVRCDAEPPAIAVVATFAELLAAWPDAIVAIDIPIGLPSRGPRVCDRLARARLGPRRASVFPAPIRPSLEAASYAEANRICREVQARGMSIEAWNIVPKIRDVDSVISAGLQDRVIEAHPELAFAEMSDSHPLIWSKKTPDGRSAREAALTAHLPLASALLQQRRPPRVAADDLLDAMATLWTAERYLRGAACRLPDEPERDERGLRMEIWF
jgi:predicted RNase H-like nuclease